VTLTLWSFIRFIHVLFAAVWIGGQITLTALLLPVLRRRLAIDVRREVMMEIGKRFGMFSLAVFVPVQIITGIALADRRGVTSDTLTNSDYGHTLLAKLAFFVLVLIGAVVHGVLRAKGNESASRIVAMATLVGSLVVILLATALPST
jgi:putative copper export protein